MDPNPIDQRIVSYLKENGESSTYKLARGIRITWSTVLTHCYKLMSEGILNHKLEKNDVSGQKKKLWSLSTGTREEDQTQTTEDEAVDIH